VIEHDVDLWAKEFLDALESGRARGVSPRDR
jgi:hypothetical protein